MRWLSKREMVCRDVEVSSAHFLPSDKPHASAKQKAK